ncbi:SNF1-related serine/threonine protein kinase KIN, putative, partial [Hepatocystis sp. ex Piliocolobus tephrosceles]
LLTTSCGSPFYTSPEILLGKKYHAELTDVWSLGIILFLLLNKKLPFKHNDINKLFSKIIKGILNFEPHVSPLAKNLIQHMLNVNYKHRYTLTDIKNHLWFSNHIMKKINTNLSPDCCNLIICDTCIYNTITKNNNYYNNLIIKQISKMYKMDKQIIYNKINDEQSNYIKTTYELLRNKTTRILSKNNYLYSHYGFIKKEVCTYNSD